MVMMSRPWRRARVVTGALFLGAVGAALAPAGPDALVPFKVLTASAADQLYAAVVVEFADGSTTSHCVPVSSGESDLQALAQVYPVGTSDSGLVCTIDNMPAGGVANCNATSNGQYFFWSYWHGSSGSWSLAGNGPAEQMVSPGDVQGWHFLNPGPLTPGNAYAPQAIPSYAQICAAEIAPATTTPAAAPPAQPGSAPAGPQGSNGSSGTTTTAAGGSSKTGHASTTTTKPTGPTTTVASSAGSNAKGPTNQGRSGGQARSTNGTALAAHSTSGAGGGNPLLPIVLVAVVILALGGFGFFRWRRRPAEE
jgi:hypothetical protein